MLYHLATREVKGKIKTYSNIQRLRRFIIYRPILKHTPKDIFPVKQNRDPRKRMKVYTKPWNVMQTRSEDDNYGTDLESKWYKPNQDIRRL